MRRQNIPYTAGCALALGIFLSNAAPALDGAAPAATAAPVAARAAEDRPSPLDAALRSFVEDQASRQTATAGARLHIDIARLDGRLPACARAEPFLVPGTRLWGRSRIGVRCLEGARWTSYVPVEVSAFGSAMVLVRPVTSGEPVAREDFQLQEIELTAEPPGLLAEPAAVENRVAARYLAVGTALRAEHLRARPVMLQGDPVKVVFLGPGFTVEGEGTAAASAVDGQSVRVQVDSGRVISGTAREGHRVEIR